VINRRQISSPLLVQYNSCANGDYRDAAGGRPSTSVTPVPLSDLVRRRLDLFFFFYFFFSHNHIGF